MGIVTGYLSQLVSSGIKLLNNGTAVSSSNPLPVSQLDGATVAGTATSAAVLFTTSMVGYESITVQVTSAGTSCTITYETSDDNANWVGCSGLSVANIGYSALVVNTSTMGILQFPRKAMYFRARVSTYGSGTVSVVGTLSKVPVAQIGNIAIAAGQGSEGVAVSAIGNPLTISAEARTANKTLVANGQIARLIATVDGRQVTRQNSIPENEWQYSAASGGITNTSDVVLQAAAGAGIKNYLTGLSVANASATATEVVVKDGSNVIWRGYVAANLPLKDIPFPTPLQSSANAALNVACITTGTQTYVNAQGYKAP